MSADEGVAKTAAKLGLPEGIPIAIGEMDVHYGAIGSGIEEGVLVKAIGTPGRPEVCIDGFATLR